MTWTYDQLRRKADQAWELAGLARQDRDTFDEQRWTRKAREYETMARGAANPNTCPTLKPIESPKIGC